MKSGDLLIFSRLVVKEISALLSSRHKLDVPKDKQEIVSLASKLDSPDINELIFAFRRIEKGMFGQCIICRHDIPEYLLRSDLTTRFCPSCQGALLEKNDTA